MARTSCYFAIAFALVIALGAIPATAQQDSAPPSGQQQEARDQFIQNITVQRDLAASTRQLAHDTHLLVGIGAIVGILELVLLAFQAIYTGRAADTAVLAQRAFLIPGEIVLAEPLAVGKEPRFVWQLRNSGPTPAVGLGAFVGFNVNGDPLPAKPAYGDEAARRPESVIGPNAPYHLPIVMPFTLAEDRLAVWNKGADLHFWVKLQYRDKFLKKHVLRTALTYNFKGPRNSVPDNPEYFEST